MYIWILIIYALVVSLCCIPCTPDEERAPNLADIAPAVVSELVVGAAVTTSNEHELVPPGTVGEIIDIRDDGKRVVQVDGHQRVRISQRPPEWISCMLPNGKVLARAHLTPVTAYMYQPRVYQPGGDDQVMEAALLTSNPLSSEPDHAHASDATTWDTCTVDKDQDDFHTDL